MSVRIALATTPAALPVDEDFGPLKAALAARGFDVEAPDWEDAAVDWSRYAAVLPRSTWNYMDRLSEFLAWTDRVARATRLFNDPATIRWNTDKRYALELERAGVPIIPTVATVVGEAWTLPIADEFVVKPAVGAGSRGAKRFRAADLDAARAHVRFLHDGGAVALTQPYLASVDTAGETALLFFAGEFSHAIRKGPLLRSAAGGGGVADSSAREVVAGLFAAEDITPRAPGADELAVGRRVLDVLAQRAGGLPLYARVDLIRDVTGQPRLLELEMTEPSLFFAHAPGSADRLAAALAQALADGGAALRSGHAHSMRVPPTGPGPA